MQGVVSVPKLYKSELDSILERIRIEREKKQQALNHKRVRLRVLPKEIAAIEKRISVLDDAKAYLERYR